MISKQLWHKLIIIYNEFTRHKTIMNMSTLVHWCVLCVEEEIKSFGEMQAKF